MVTKFVSRVNPAVELRIVLCHAAPRVLWKNHVQEKNLAVKNCNHDKTGHDAHSQLQGQLPPKRRQEKPAGFGVSQHLPAYGDISSS